MAIFEIAKKWILVKKNSWNWFIGFHEFLWPGLFLYSEFGPLLFAAPASSKWSPTSTRCLTDSFWHLKYYWSPPSPYLWIYIYLFLQLMGTIKIRDVQIGRRKYINPKAMQTFTWAKKIIGGGQPVSKTNIGITYFWRDWRS